MRAIYCLLFVFSVSAQASYLSNEECVQVYRDKALELKEQVDYYNNKRIDKKEFIAEVTSISAIVAAQRAACSVVEDPAVEECVESAKKLYSSIRDQINLRAVLFGNQNSVEYSRAFKVQETIHNLKCRKYN